MKTSSAILVSLIALQVQAESMESGMTYLEDFESRQVTSGSRWELDSPTDTDPLSEAGSYFTQQGIEPPTGYRQSIAIGENNWLTAELYSRSNLKKVKDLLCVVDDPAGSANKVLKLSTPEHTDAAILRSTLPLPPQYQISLRVGFPQYGDGKSELNGYDSGDERAEPWMQTRATEQNGFYWLAIIDQTPKPHNNIWIHHHRKFVIDTDNHNEDWMEIFDGTEFITSGENPIMVFALDGKGKQHPRIGVPFISYSNSKWQDSGLIRAVDAYLPDQWYRVVFTRTHDSYHFEIEGTFKFGGKTVYKGQINFKEHQIWHSDQKDFPDFFMLGDPHINFYEGHVYFDDISLKIL
jgi:hypothetical protein